MIGIYEAIINHILITITMPTIKPNNNNKINTNTKHNDNSSHNTTH